MTPDNDARTAAILDRFRLILRRYPRGNALFFTRRVNRPAGSMLAAILFDTPVTSNMISLAGFIVHGIAAALLVSASPPVSLGVWIAILVLWQLAFSLDCADGQLARARQAASPFGAWLDIFLDVVTHVLVYGALAIYVARALELDGVPSAAVAGGVMGGHLIQLFTSFAHGRLGSAPAVSHPPSWLRLALRAEHLLDYGWFLFAIAVLLPWPQVLLAALLLSATLHVVSAAVQLALNWRRELQGLDRET